MLRTAIIQLDYFPIVKTDKTRLVDYFTLVYLFVGVWWRGDFAWWRVGWWRGGELVASWLVAKLPGGEMTGNRCVTTLITAAEETRVHSVLIYKWLLLLYYNSPSSPRA